METTLQEEKLMHQNQMHIQQEQNKKEIQHLIHTYQEKIENIKSIDQLKYKKDINHLKIQQRTT